MEPDVVRLYSSTLPPLDKAAEQEEEDEFGEFGSFGDRGVMASCSFSELDMPITFNQSNALEDSPPDLYITSVQNLTLSEKNRWANERKISEEAHRPCVVSNLETSEGETEVHSCTENIKKESLEILTNGVTYSDPQKELSEFHSSTGRNLDGTGDGHNLSNGHSEQEKVKRTFLKSTENRNNSGLDDGLDGTQEINQTDNLQDSNSNSSPKEESEPVEMGVGMELSDDSQSFSPCKDVQEAEGMQEHKENKGTEDKGLPGAAGSSSEDFVICSVTGVSKAATAPTIDMDITSDTQLSRDTREIHGSSDVEVNEDIKAFNETPTDRTAEEDFGDFRDVTQGFADFSQTESLTQERFADFVTAMSRCSSDDEFGDTDTLKDFKEEYEPAEEEEKSADSAGDEGGFCSELPPSDSFADFSSVPFGGVAVGEEENWASFGQREGIEESQDSWAAFGEEQTTFVGKAVQDYMTSAVLSSDNLQRSRMDKETTEFSCTFQHLFRSTFPSDVSPEVSGVTEVLTLKAALQAQDAQELRDPSSSFALGNALAIWLHVQDIHGTHGLKFKWAGSHSNRLLLDCLGIRNILLTGEKKQPVIVPMFAAGLGMLEPTKESSKSPASPALSPSTPVENGNILYTQVAPSLAVSIDGVDPELYELTTAKIETNTTGQSGADAFTKLMELMEKTRTTARKPDGKDEKLSEEAEKVISLLPDLSFMQGRVLMFPSILTPAANHT
ncbi:aftiphilin-like isoform X1 [Myxocyprinus asiaticus]|uniref:aftiphilin-like isoform X1 n=1 Tax=Myxocyprinus asiaticus TaxID=70543 RepID=UPI0022224F2A|nr:aftiphilin-like isoform X1 [Myxocyprinus asiaticus]